MFIKDIGIDLGTANTLIYLRGRGIIIREPSVVAVNTHTDSAKYVGKEAKEVIGRTPGSIVAVKPLKNGVIADFETTTIMLQEFIRKALRGKTFTKARVIICVPSGVTTVERRAVKEAVEQAGAKYVLIVEEAMAAAIGAGLPTLEPIGSMIVDIGGGTSEAAMSWMLPSSTTSESGITCSSANALRKILKSKLVLHSQWNEKMPWKSKAEIS